MANGNGQLLQCPIDSSPIPPVLPMDDDRSLALNYLDTTDGDGDGIIRQTELYSNRRNPGPYHCVILALGFTSHNTTKTRLGASLQSTFYHCDYYQYSTKTTNN